MDIKRRPLLTEKGDTLLLSKSSLDTAYRFSEWQEITGLGPTRFTANTLCSVPLPIYTQVRPGGRQFSDVRPEALWNPLFWLPARLAGRYNLPTGTEGAMEVESTALWSVRVALELTASGLYDANEGWLDILATVGIDVDNEADLARIEEWQAGSPDEVLDSIDLDLYLKLDRKPNWALESAIILLEPLTRAQWAILSDSLMDMLQEATSLETNSSMDEIREALAIAASLAGVQLSGVPTDPEESAEVFWDRVEMDARDGLFTVTQQIVDGPVAEAIGWLRLTRDTYWESLSDLQQLETV